MLHPSMILFFFFLITSLILTASTKSILIMWFALEINSMSFIPILIKKKCKYSTESAMKYFIAQSFSSIIFIISTISKLEKPTIMLMIMLALIIKITMIPMHQWFVSMVEMLDWSKLNMLLTVQKVIPLIIMSFFFNMNYFNNFMFKSIIMINAIFSSMAMFSQSSLRKMMSYSSITQMSWITTAMSMSLKMWLTNFILYTMIISIINSSFSLNKMNTMNSLLSGNKSNLDNILMNINILSLSGLPPFMGFILKFNVINLLMYTKNSILMMIILMLSSLMSMYMYMNMITKSSIKSSIMINNKKKETIILNIMPIILTPLTLMI